MTPSQIKKFKNSDRYDQGSRKFSHDESQFTQEEITILEEGRHQAYVAWKQIETEKDDSEFRVTDSLSNAGDSAQGKAFDFDSEAFYRCAIATYDGYEGERA